MRYEAVLFDLDGTLIESVPLWIEAYRNTLAQFGASMNEDDFLHKIYLQNKKLSDVLFEYDIDEQESAVRVIRDANYCDLVRKSTLWYPEAEKVFSAVCKQMPAGIVTGSWGQYVEAENSVLRLTEKTNTIITADHTQDRGKPDPYGILLACEQLGVNPLNCVYVGDVMVDVKAAANAGMESFVIRRSHTPDDAANAADHTADSLDDLLKHLEL